MNTSVKRGNEASKLIDGRIRELGDWRGKTLEKVRRLIKEADPEVGRRNGWRMAPTHEPARTHCVLRSLRARVIS